MKNQPSIILKITFSNQIRSLFPFLLFFCGWTGGGFYYFKDVDFSSAPPLTSEGIIVLLFVITILAFITLPALLFHIDYFIKNKHEEYEIGDGKIIRRKKGVGIVYYFEEIDDVYMYVTPPKYREDFRLWAWDNYHFARIVMKSGEVLYLTSLLYPSGIDKVFKQYLKGVNYWCEKRWFPTTLVDFSHDKDEDEQEDYPEISLYPRKRKHKLIKY